MNAILEPLFKTHENMEEPKKKNKKISKDVLNIIRTTMRNNIDLTHIADNKANVLLTLNALMLTFLIPFIIQYLDLIREFRLFVPLLILILTCLVTIYISVLVLKPSKFYENQKDLEKGNYISPFFFGNYYKMEKADFKIYIKNAVSDVEKVKGYITDDLHYIGTRLGRKMALIRIAFSIFLWGLISSILLAIFLVLWHGVF